MKHDLCTNPILASQLPHTDVSPACIHRHTSQDATLACTWHSSLLCTSTKCWILTFTTRFLSVFTYFLICFPLYLFCLCPHLSHTFPFSFLFITLTVPHTLLPTYLYMVFMKSPSHHSLCLFTSVSVIPLSAMQLVYHIGAYSGGMGGPVLLADFNELLWGSDQRHQKQHSAIQFARFNASLLTTVSSLDMMKAPAAGRMTRETSSKHMWSVICWKGFCRESGKSHMSGINISAVLSSHLFSVEEKMETGILDRDWGFARHERKWHCSIADRWFQNQKHEISHVSLEVYT